jgi:TonB-linked SusC/RagA family outer membrane protein
VKIQGTGSGTVTDHQGKYSITVPDRNAVLAYSFIGYVTQEITVGTKVLINVQLIEEAVSLDEVVVVGFGTQKKVNLTGAIGIATAKELRDRPVIVAAQALQGLVPGLNISQNNGSLDSKPNLKIRGRGTIGAGSSGEPLILIDGIEGDINVLNPSDIESVSVLKDAAASSIYGAKAPFGVILITTRSGAPGRTTVSYNNNMRWNSPILLPEFPDSYTFAAYFNDACVNVPGWGTHFNDNWMEGIKDFQEGKTTVAATVYANNRSMYDDGFDPRAVYKSTSGVEYTNVGGLDNRDYYKELIRPNAFSQEHNISVSGGKEKITYYTSFGMLDQNGLMVFNQDSYKRFTAMGKMSYAVSQWITLAYNNRFSRDIYNRPSQMTNNLFKTIGRQCWPLLPMYDGNGNLFEWRAVELRDGGNDKTITDNSYQQLQLTFEPIRDWKTFVDLSYSIKNLTRHWDSFPLYHYDVDNNPYVYANASGGNVHEEARKDDLFGLNIYTEYTFALREKHHFKAMVGFQEQQMDQLAFGLQRNGVIFPELPEVDLTNGLDHTGTAVTPSVNGSRNTWTNIGGFGRFNYDYDNKYLFEANLRYDASSRFRTDHRSVYSPSFSAGWNIAREAFFEPLAHLVDMLKLRASYGQLANMNTSGWYPTYSNIGLYASSGAWLQGDKRTNTATPPGTVENPYLTWEKIKSTNIGLDFSLLNSRLTGGFDYYVRKTTDMLGPAPQLPAVLGVSPKRANDTALKDYGFEFQISWSDRLSNGLRYGMRLLLSDYQTEVLEYPSNKTGNILTYYPGKKVGDLWGYTTVGIAKTQEEMDAHLAAVGGQNDIFTSWGAGDIMYADIDGKAGISPGGRTLTDHGDLSIIGNSTPRYQFGIDLNAEWKGIDFRAFFQGIGKRDFWQGNYFFWGATSGGGDESGASGDNITDGGMWNSTGLKTHMDYFRDEDTWSVKKGINTVNPNSYYPKPYFAGDNGKNRKIQTRYLQDASYIRLKNIQLGYTLPPELTHKIGVDRIRLFFSGENLWTATNMIEVFDPESIDGGWNGSVYPLSRVLSLGLNINF